MFNCSRLFALAAFLAAGLGAATPAAAYFQRNYIHIVGSSTVLPYSKAVGEKFAKAKKFHLPRLESTGTSGGIKLFCEGTGGDYPDIVNTSRPLKPKELDECRKAGVTEIVEVKIGYDALVLAQAKQAPPLALTRREARLALAKWVAGRTGQPVPNPNTRWNRINPALPDSPIEIYGPPPSSGTHDAFVDLVSESECRGRPWVEAGKTEPSPELLKKCRAIRDDGVYVEGRENDEDLIEQLSARPGRLALFDYKHLAAHRDRLRAVPIEGVEPDPASIASRRYPGARPLLMYVKADQVGRTPGLKEYLAEFTQEKTWGDKGYLAKLGLIPSPAAERKAYAADAKALKSMP
jgi:phosphate transport system substrate-binding protein